MSENVIFSSLISLGNSQGIELPKSLLEISGIKNKIKISVDKGQIIISAIEEKMPRYNWAESFKEMNSNNDDKLLDEDAINLSSWDEEEWEW